jgi:hypothetical protein
MTFDANPKYDHLLDAHNKLLATTDGLRADNARLTALLGQCVEAMTEARGAPYHNGERFAGLSDFGLDEPDGHDVRRVHSLLDTAIAAAGEALQETDTKEDGNATAMER